MSARSLNRVMLIGNLTRDPDMRYTPNGNAVCTFGLATNRSWTTDAGQAQEETEYHRLVAWGKLAEICGQLLFKGRKVYCEGRLQSRRWTGQDGQERQTTEIVIDNMIALSQPKGNGYSGEDGIGDFPNELQADHSSMSSETPVAAPKPVRKPKPKAEPETAPELDVDDIPF